MADKNPIVKGSSTGSESHLGAIPLITYIDVLVASMRQANSALEQTITVRLDAIDKATTLLHSDMVRMPTDVDRQVKHIRELHDEKFSGIQVQFSERDERVKSTAEQTKTAVDAALQAAKEAVNKQEIAFGASINKSEATVKDQIEALATTLQVTTSGLQTSLNDLKGRVITIESLGLGRSAARTDQREIRRDDRAGAGEVRAYIALAAMLILFVITVAGFFIANTGA